MITKLTVELDGYEPIDFTMNEAKELYEQLRSLFEPKQTVIHHHDYWWNRPYYTWSSTSGATTTVRGSSTNGFTSLNDLANKTVTSDNTNMRVTYHDNN